MKSTAIKSALQPAAPSRAEVWAKTWGETVSKSKCARMLGISKWKLYQLLDVDALELTADERVFTRSAAEYAEHGSQKLEKPKPRMHFVK